MEYYKSSDLQDAFSVSHTTIQKWAIEFAAYLSPTANPEPGRKRLFTPDDVKTLALVNEHSKTGGRWEDAHIALRMGQRGELPIFTTLAGDVPPALIDTLRNEIMNARQQLAELDNKYKMTLGQNVLLREQLAEKERQIQELYERLAEVRASVKQ